MPHTIRPYIVSTVQASVGGVLVSVIPYYIIVSTNKYRHCVHSVSV